MEALLRSIAVVFLLGYGAIFTVAYHTGAPDQACADMVPAGHGVAAQTGKSPYRILLQTLEIKNGEPLTITLTAPTIGPPFKGFFIQMRQVKGSNEPMGTFNPTSDPKLAQPVTCGGKQNVAMTHKDNIPKVQVTLQWTPPPGDGEYVPIVTFVKQQDTFWVQEKPDEKTIKVTGPSGRGGSTSTGTGQQSLNGSSTNNNNNETGQGAATSNLPFFVLTSIITFAALTLLR